MGSELGVGQTLVPDAETGLSEGLREVEEKQVERLAVDLGEREDDAEREERHSREGEPHNGHELEHHRERHEHHERDDELPPRERPHDLVLVVDELRDDELFHTRQVYQNLRIPFSSTMA